MDVVIGVNGWIKRKKIETEEEQKMVKALEEAARKAEKEQKKDQPIEAVAFDADSFSDSAKAAAVAAVAVDAGNPQAESEAVAVPTDVPVESKGAVPTESKTQGSLSVLCCVYVFVWLVWLVYMCFVYGVLPVGCVCVHVPLAVLLTFFCL